MNALPISDEARSIFEDERFRRTLSRHLEDGEVTRNAMLAALLDCYPDRRYSDRLDEDAFWFMFGEIAVLFTQEHAMGL